MSDANRQYIQDGIDGYEAEIEDLNNKLADAHRRIDEERATNVRNRFRIDELEGENARMKRENQHRETQDSWRKVTGLRGF